MGDEGNGGTRGTGGTVAFEKAPQNFYTGDGYGWSLCKSMCAPIWFRPVHEKIVRERLGGAIRTLRGEIAGFRFYGMNVHRFWGVFIVFSPWLY